MNRHKFHDVACQGNLKFCQGIVREMSGKFEILSGNCQGNVREFCFRWSVAFLVRVQNEVVGPK